MVHAVDQLVLPRRPDARNLVADMAARDRRRTLPELHHFSRQLGVPAGPSRPLRTRTGTTPPCPAENANAYCWRAHWLRALSSSCVRAAGPVLDVLTPQLLGDVFGVRARTERHPDGVLRLT